MNPDYMTPDVEAAIIKLVEGQSKNIPTLKVHWYGGEPLMNLGTFERLSRKFIDICDKNNIEYTADMVTNGYLFTKKNIELLNELRVTSVQITLDGNKENHDARRPFADGSGTFDVIINNLSSNKDILPRISLRVNVDRNTIASAKDIVKILEERGLTGKVNPYLGKITNYNNSNNNSGCYDLCDFAKEDLNQYIEKLDDENFTKGYPRPVTNICSADSINSFIINADGRMYKCLTDIGISERSVGNLADGTTINNDIFLYYMLFDPMTDPTCTECKLLPLCMGGCPAKKLNGDTDVCSRYKYVLDNYLSIISKKLKLKKDLKTENVREA
jgi:uncharacterized protein